MVNEMEHCDKHVTELHKLEILVAQMNISLKELSNNVKNLMRIIDLIENDITDIKLEQMRQRTYTKLILGFGSAILAGAITYIIKLT